jgi:hypothetical protein
MDDPFDDITKLRIDPNAPAFKTSYVPARIRKRREQFVMVPMAWHDALKNPLATGLTVLLAIYLCHLDWKNHGKPFKLPNGMLEYDGVCRQTKWRVLRELERRGLISVECRSKKSPIIHMRQMGR